MGKARAAATLVAIAALALLVPAAGAAQEKSYSLPQAVVDVQIASDGSLLVREDITFSFSGSFSGAYRDIPVRAGERVDLVSVSEGGRRYQPGGNTDLGSFDQPGKYGVERTRSGCAWSGTTAHSTSSRTSRSATGSAASPSPTTTSST